MEGQASHDLLKTAIESLTCMTHRGGIAADGKTGDGCGLLLKMPESFMREVAQEVLGIKLGERFAVGSIFLPDDDAREARGRETLEAELTRRGLKVLGWREVPVDPVSAVPWRWIACRVSGSCSSSPANPPVTPSMSICSWRASCRAGVAR